MEYSNYSSLFKELKNKQYKPVYILHGAEPYFIDLLTHHFEHQVLPEGERSFNQDVLYGIDIDAGKVKDYANQYPMMAERRVVVVKEARFMKDLKGLESYLLQPSPQTILVIAHPDKKIDGKLSLLKKAKKSPDIGVFLSDPVTEWKLEEWIRTYLKSEGLTMNPDGVSLLAQSLGTDLKKIVNEIEKLRLNIDGRTNITEDDIDQYIGISKEYNVFALCKAISTRDVVQMQYIATNLAENVKKEPLVKLLPAIASHIEKILIAHQNLKSDRGSAAKAIGVNPYIVPEYLAAARNYSEDGLKKIYALVVAWDGRVKGVNNRQGEQGLLQELIGNIIITH